MSIISFSYIDEQWDAKIRNDIRFYWSNFKPLGAYSMDGHLTHALQLPPGPAIAIHCAGLPVAKATVRDAPASSMEFVPARAREACRQKDVRWSLRA